MNLQLAQIAANVPGIGTAHYLYLNESVSLLRGTEAAAPALRAIESLPGHREILDRCGFPEDRNPSDRLMRMAVSSSYCEALDEDRRSIRPLMRLLGRFSGENCPPELLRRLAPQDRIVILGPNRVEVPRGLRQIQTAALQFKESSRLSPPEDSVVDVLDTVLPCYHLLFGCLMVYRRLGEQAGAGTLVMEEGLEWFALSKGFLGVMEGIYEWIAPKIRAGTDANLVAGALKGEKMQLIDDVGFRKIAAVFLGIDIVLGVLEAHLSQGTGTLAAATARQTRELREGKSLPLLKRFAALTRPVPPTRSTIRGQA
ncbi:MAG TPA: hypothetical protein VFX30_04595 [bacterium]|nr:hypothetical protein [bacterium]